MILSDYLENKLLNLMFDNTAFSPPATLYFGLFTADPGESGVTGEFTIGTGSYARAVVTNNTTNFPLCSVLTTPTKTNASTIAFPKATTAWGVATHWAIYDASTAGNMLAHGALSSPRTISIGDTPKIAAGAMSVTISNASTGGLTAFAKRKLLDHVFGASVYTSAATLYSGLGTALTDDVLTEWTDANYSRQSTEFTAATGDGVILNTSAQTYNANVATGAVTLTHYGVWDASAAGNLLVTGALDSSRTVAATDTAGLTGSGSITIALQ